LSQPKTQNVKLNPKRSEGLNSHSTSSVGANYRAACRYQNNGISINRTIIERSTRNN